VDKSFKKTSIHLILSLAIVIPAFKGTFLKETLTSLVNQTDKCFTVYIGDDSSPEDLHTIVEVFRLKLNFFYKKFDYNLGTSDLAAQWNRCISLVNNEKWIWLLPDDDLISPNCVSEFYRTISNDMQQSNLYRFETAHIDGSGHVLFKTQSCPPVETMAEFVINKLSFKRNSSVAEYIFSRESFLNVKGFTSFPLAWGSDDYLWVCLSKQIGIRLISSGVVYLRQSHLNISSNLSQEVVKKKFAAKYIYLNKILSNSEISTLLYQSIEKKELKLLIAQNLFFEYQSYKIDFSLLSLIKFSYKNNTIIGGGFIINIYRLLRYKMLVKNSKKNVRSSSSSIVL
jgi:glycosyltransferase involved in cell wall biosynthesis